MHFDSHIGNAIVSSIHLSSFSHPVWFIFLLKHNFLSSYNENDVLAHYVYMANNPILFSLKFIHRLFVCDFFSALHIFFFLFLIFSLFVQFLGFHRLGQMQSTITCTIHLFPFFLLLFLPLPRTFTMLFTLNTLQPYNALHKKWT